MPVERKTITKKNANAVVRIILHGGPEPLRPRMPPRCSFWIYYAGKHLFLNHNKSNHLVIYKIIPTTNPNALKNLKIQTFQINRDDVTIN